MHSAVIVEPIEQSTMSSLAAVRVSYRADEWRRPRTSWRSFLSCVIPTIGLPAHRGNHLLVFDELPLL